MAHADWSVHPAKRVMAVATAGRGRWRVRVEAVGDVGALPARLRAEAGGRAVLLGVDAPIGVPIAYASRHLAGVADFRAFLAGLADDSRFFEVCDDVAQVCGARPFFPRTTLGRPRRAAHAEALGLAEEDLLRRCDRRTATRPAAESLFWTLGAKQAGKGALVLWREMLRAPGLRLWPFDGELGALLAPGAVVVAECYPAEALRQLGLVLVGSKRRQGDRRALAGGLRARFGAASADAEPGLLDEIADGFGVGPGGEDRFDSLVGLMGSLQVLGRRDEGGVPEDWRARRWEGWILGQGSR